MKINQIIAFAISFLFCSFSYSQTTVKVNGVVTDNNNEPLIGVSIYPKSDPTKGRLSDIDGRYELNATAGGTIVFSFVGFTTEERKVGTADRQVINIVLDDAGQMLEEVSVVGYGTQRKVSVIGSISTLNPNELLSGGVTSVTNNLAGRIAGLIGIQSSGEPGSDVSEFWIRGISTFGGGSSALVLIDGIDRGTSGLSTLAPEDIATFSVLKDATATAIYGARGGNGVIIVTTKRGQEGKISISANVKTSLEELPRLPKYLGAHEYALLANEARVVRGGLPVYSPEIFDILKYKMDPDLYPDVNWQDEILRKKVLAAQGNVNISGGGKLSRYYMSLSYRTNDAIYKQDGMKQYHSNVRRNQYSFRSNIDVDVTKTTEVRLSLSAKLIDQNRPGLGATDQIWEAVSNTTPMLVPVIYSNGMNPSYGAGNMASPSVLLNQTGYRADRENSIETLLSLEQRFDFLTEGLKATASVSFDNNNAHMQTRYKMPDLYMAVDRNWQTGELLTTKTVVASPMNYNSWSIGKRTIYIEGKIDYEKLIAEKHRVGALFLYQQKDFQRTDVSTELSSIPERNQGIAGRLTYSYDNIYFLEGNFGYNGSENFPKGQRFGFFPSVALGYVVSNYDFFQKKLPIVDMLKFRYSFGLVGNDKIYRGNQVVRFPYLTKVNMSAPGYFFGDVPGYYSGVTDSELGSTGLVWESAKKHNWGLDLALWNSAISVTVDAFIDKRDNIFMERNTLPGTLGVGSIIWGNVGRMKSWGADGSASITRKFGDFTIEARGNFTLTRDKIIDYDEVIPRYPYLARKGTPNGTTRGLIALGLFKDEDDVKNSPTQFGKVLPGDIKYQDVNGDGVINADDIVPIGNSRIPKIMYGFAGTVMWKGIDINVFFRGAGQSDFFFGGSGFYPFEGEKTGNVLTIVNNQKNRWTPESYSGDPSTENPNARFPRLTYGKNENNNRNSTFWLANASYLRLKTVEIGYTIPKELTKKFAMTNVRISLIGDNLYVWDKVKFWDPEQASKNGAVYPLPRSYTLVLQMSF